MGIYDKRVVIRWVGEVVYEGLAGVYRLSVAIYGQGTPVYRMLTPI